ncbi:MAG TPA: protein translocase subunit SecD, partial [Anaerolineae bacterium]|nr:protein translocase subunit SecD [Anaerolineae bacterium]
MNRKTLTSLVLILLLAAVALYLVVPSQHPEWLTRLLVWQPETARSLEFMQGLDLQGGLQLSMVADVPAGQELSAETMRAAAQVVEGRVNALGLSEPVVQVQGTRRIIVELPGIADPEQAIDTIRDTA